ncbi:MAG TPA: DUF4055 domain-containing protein [Verrucomicrobiota bacterium]|nr:DUF4055 domain-containing protein [Verrucomicrobiota bacterium]HOQ57373.1 DUF4055 domain-containing protein [Verrucomicrobiota bacterium]HPC51882.1 DUF4055 domain-containing protein [Verrucomicrobiota bacterium]HPL37727.1 DUF4055 domain-containing protein [Verrucomicrobiota bacterium]HRV39107.1 DUF4055 domain-containing protein [Candidatus Paceibacterota bacterium]
MPVNSTHVDYEAAAPSWARARDVLAGEDAVKAGGEKYLARLDGQTDEEFAAYGQRASFFNATARTAEAYQGLIFRRPPFVKLPEASTGAGRALAEFQNDTDLLGTSLSGYAKVVVGDVVGLGRAGSLVDWEAEAERRAYAVFYPAERIRNWRMGRVRGRNVLTLLVLAEKAEAGTPEAGRDEFEPEVVEQLRVLRLVGGDDGAAFCRVDLWREQAVKGKRDKTEWVLVESRVPRRLGKPLPLIPFVFHGPRHSRPDVDRGPLEDIIAVNLDHYRLDADFKHGLHFTALPTAWVSGFDKTASLRIGSSQAWVSETPGATAGFLEFRGQGLETFERAMDRDERLMAVLGSRMLEDVKKVGETATAIELRQSGEYSILGNVAMSVSESLTQVLRWVYWWNSTEELPDDVSDTQVLMQLNTDFSTKGLASQDVQAIVAAWQAGAISQDTMFEVFRRGEVLPEGRTNPEEAALIKSEERDRPAVKAMARAQDAAGKT